MAPAGWAIALAIAQPDRALARRMAAEAAEAGRPLDWFERLYEAGERGEATVPWVNRVPNPHLLAWADAHHLAGDGRRALVVGCGLGDDAEALAGRTFSVVAFDLAPTAVEACRRRFPATSVHYVVADLLAPPPGWEGAFDLVFEANTVQVLPFGPLRRAGIARLSTFVAPGGRLLVVARRRAEGEPPGELPWPLAPSELLALGGDLAVEEVTEVLGDDEDPPVRRWVASFRRPA